MIFSAAAGRLLYAREWRKLMRSPPWDDGILKNVRLEIEEMVQGAGRVLDALQVDNIKGSVTERD